MQPFPHGPPLAGFPQPPFPPPQIPGDDRGFSSQPTHTVWIGGLHASTSEQELYRIFGAFGHVENIKSLPQKNCAFVRFGSLDDAIRAHTNMTGKYIGGQLVKIGWGKPDAVAKEQETGPPPCKNLWLGNIEPGCTERELLPAWRFGFLTYLGSRLASFYERDGKAICNSMILLGCDF